MPYVLGVVEFSRHHALRGSPARRSLVMILAVRRKGTMGEWAMKMNVEAQPRRSPKKKKKVYISSVHKQFKKGQSRIDHQTEWGIKHPPEGPRVNIDMCSSCVPSSI